MKGLTGLIVFTLYIVTYTLARPLNPVILGGDIDEYGCKQSAGYTWSNLTETCIKQWEN